MNLLATIGSFFAHLMPGYKSPVPVTQDATQQAINKLGVIADGIEGYVTELQALAPLLPPQAAGPLAVFAAGYKPLEAYVDSIETPAASTPVAAPATAAAPGTLPTANL